MRRIFLVPFLLLLWFVLGGCVGGAPDHNVLFIGNSYTHRNDMPAMVRKIADANGVKIATTMMAPDGAFLDEHAVNPDVLAALASGEYDTVVIQEQSVGPSDATFAATRTKPAAVALSNAALSSGSRVVWFQSWGHLNGFPEVGHASYESMQAAIIATYDDIARSAAGSVARVGERWRRVLSSGTIVLYSPDGSHPSPAGSYLAAIEITNTIIAPQVVEAPSVSGVDDATAAAILAG